MPRKRRPENVGLPARWRYLHGAYHYCVPPGLEARWDGKQQFRLGKTLAEAHRAFAARIETPGGELETIGQALDKYAVEVVPLKAPATQAGNFEAIKRLKEVFAEVHLLEFQSHQAYQYRNKRKDKHGRPALTAANRELEVLSHLFTMCFEWGVPLATHPMIEGKFKKKRPDPRTRYVEDWEIVEALRIKPVRKKGSVRMCQAYIKVKLLSGKRRTELLRLKVTDIGAETVRWTLSKTVKKTGQLHQDMDLSDELRAALEEAKAARPVDIGPYVFCNSSGESYLKEDGSANGFDSIWQRFMDRVMAETEVKERFAERDLRAKCATDAESLERAREILAHASMATTKRIYKRKPERVKPLR